MKRCPEATKQKNWKNADYFMSFLHLFLRLKTIEKLFSILENADNIC